MRPKIFAALQDLAVEYIKEDSGNNADTAIKIFKPLARGLEKDSDVGATKDTCGSSESCSGNTSKRTQGTMQILE